MKEESDRLREEAEAARRRLMSVSDRARLEAEERLVTIFNILSWWSSVASLPRFANTFARHRDAKEQRLKEESDRLRKEADAQKKLLDDLGGEADRLKSEKESAELEKDRLR